MRCARIRAGCHELGASSGCRVKTRIALTPLHSLSTHICSPRRYRLITSCLLGTLQTTTSLCNETTAFSFLPPSGESISCSLPSTRSSEVESLMPPRFSTAHQARARSKHELEVSTCALVRHMHTYGFGTDGHAGLHAGQHRLCAHPSACCPKS